MSTRATYRSSAPPAGRVRRFVAALLLVACAAPGLSFTLPPAVVITRLTDLDFGDVATDATKQIHYSDAGASSFRIDATDFIAQTSVAVSLTLPAILTSGGDVVAVSYSNADAAWSYTNSAAGATAFDPHSGVTIAKNGANFTVYIWIGGGITTISTTTQSTYSGSLTLDAEAQ